MSLFRSSGDEPIKFCTNCHYFNLLSFQCCINEKSVNRCGIGFCLQRQNCLRVISAVSTLGPDINLYLLSDASWSKRNDTLSKIIISLQLIDINLKSEYADTNNEPHRNSSRTHHHHLNTSVYSLSVTVYHTYTHTHSPFHSIWFMHKQRQTSDQNNNNESNYHQTPFPSRRVL